MDISISYAQEIVTEIGSITGKNINLMDERGCIIASTDSKRIGSMHRGAQEIIRRNLDELYIPAHEETKDTKMGLNLAIKEDEKIVGVVGMTGAYESVCKYGKIVKKMAEILIREKKEEDSRTVSRRMKKRFLEEWVLEDALHVYGKDFVERGLAFGIDVTQQRRVMVVGILEFSGSVDQILEQDLIESLERKVGVQPKALCFRYVGRLVILLRVRRNEEMTAFAKQLQSLAEKEYGVNLAVGIDGEAGNICAAYRQAERAWQAARTMKGHIGVYQEIVLEMVMDEISIHTKKDYIERIFPDQREDELIGWMKLLEAYFFSEGSLYRAAELLFIHKNTLQYRLLRLKELTGYDVRKASDSVVLYIAWIFHMQLQEEKNI